MSPLLSIVTVVKNDAAGFRSTADSIVTSTSVATDDVEWIVVDGSSSRDDIPSIVAQADLNPRYRWSQPNGVFEAMNVGLDMVTGQYVYFLNAGDRLREETSLHSIIHALNRHHPVWMFGQVAFLNDQGEEVIPEPFDYDEQRAALFARGRFPPHQGTVVTVQTLRTIGGFDTQYRITADYTAMLRLSAMAKPLQIPDVVAEFSAGGISDRRWLLALNEFHRARLEVFQPSSMTLVREFADTAAVMLRTAVHRTIRR